jgi:hypothetical protein
MKRALPAATARVPLESQMESTIGLGVRLSYEKESQSQLHVCGEMDPVKQGRQRRRRHAQRDVKFEDGSPVSAGAFDVAHPLLA